MGKYTYPQRMGEDHITNSISNRQLFFILLMTSIYTTLPKLMAQDAGRTSWIPILFVSLLFAVAAVFMTKLNNLFVGKVFFDYSQEVIGKFFAYLFTSYFALAFLIIGVNLNLKMIESVRSNFLPKTPNLEFLAFGIALFAYVSYKGITNMARLFEIYGLSFLVVSLVILTIVMVDGDKYNILPFFNPSDVKEFAKSIKDLIVPFEGLAVLLVIPFTVKNKKATKTAFFSLIFIGFFDVFAVESTIMILGINNTALLNDGLIEAIKLAQAPIIERMDIFYITFGLAGILCGIIFVFYAIVEFVCRIFSKVKRLTIVITVAIIFFIVCMFAINMKEIDKTDENIIFYLTIVSDFLIPVTVFTLAKIKKRNSHKNEVYNEKSE